MWSWTWPIKIQFKKYFPTTESKINHSFYRRGCDRVPMSWIIYLEHFIIFQCPNPSWIETCKYTCWLRMNKNPQPVQCQAKLLASLPRLMMDACAFQKSWAKVYLTLDIMPKWCLYRFLTIGRQELLEAQTQILGLKSHVTLKNSMLTRVTQFQVLQNKAAK